MRQLSALTVRLVFPSSRTKKTSPLARATKITNMIIKMKVLINICYTPAINNEANNSSVESCMTSLTGFNRRFTPSWQMSIAALIAILILARLGFWQLQRADEKEQMLNAHHSLAQQKPILWEPNNKLPTQYQQIQVQGTYLAKTLLLDNQHHHHQFGYHVISPLLLANGQILLVDRGWLAGDITRQVLPMTKTPTGSIQVQGGVYYPSQKNWRLGQLFEKELDNSVVIELVDTKIIGQFLHKSVYPYIMRLGEHEASGYVREWAVVAMPPHRHYAYALQWFAMALVVFIIFIVLNTKKKYETKSS